MRRENVDDYDDDDDIEKKRKKKSNIRKVDDHMDGFNVEHKM